MYTFVQMTLNNQSDREERLLGKLDNIARNLFYHPWVISSCLYPRKNQLYARCSVLSGLE